MKLTPVAQRRQSTCQICQQLLHRRLYTSGHKLTRPIELSPSRGLVRAGPRRSLTISAQRKLDISRVLGTLQRRSLSSASNAFEDEVQAVLQRGKDIISNKDVAPSEEQIENLFERCQALASKFSHGHVQVPKASGRLHTAFSALLSLDNEAAPKETSLPSLAPEEAASQKKLIDSLSNLLYQLVCHPPVFISTDVLKSYVTIQTMLRKPDTFPRVFTLYARKPIAKPGSSPLRYRKSNPNRAQCAIPKTIADMALDSAIGVKNLALALGIIHTSYATPAYRRAKIFRRGLLPIVGFSLVPPAAYVAAHQLAEQQLLWNMYPTVGQTFFGILAYVGFTSTIGLVAVATANDHMDRVTWVVGMPLRDRWLGEDERAAFDKVAAAWGFKDRIRRGEEEGEEWDSLRELIGLRGMVLDRVEFMEGME